MDRPKVAVVVASHNARYSIEECLTALVTQWPKDEVEIVVVDNSTDGTTEVISKRFPELRLIVERSSLLIPELWGIGLYQSAAEIVAITTAHCIPDKDWLTQILKAHEVPFPAIGGAIENSDSARLVDWAVYFCRYSPYMLPFQEGFVAEIAGDNASYKRAYIDQWRHVWRNGFWESVVHAELRKAGLRLLLVPSIVIHHKRSFGLWAFIKQRFQHGMQFGRERASRFSIARRILYIALSPVIPFVMLVRIVQQVVTKRRHLGKLLQALPIVGLFLSAWALGELVGYLCGQQAR
jgi:glycosyltransferase involved in cell wall biosynthesis